MANKHYLVRFERCMNETIIWIMEPGSWHEESDIGYYNSLGEAQIAALEGLTRHPGAEIRYLSPVGASYSPNPKPQDLVLHRPGDLIGIIWDPTIKHD